ncbi:MAG: hypothetical protein KAX05_00640 [Bacteroidales bacterium]|nr:hypothetical protein [Bacteroidales bacterium]
MSGVQDNLLLKKDIKSLIMNVINKSGKSNKPLPSKTNEFWLWMKAGKSNRPCLGGGGRFTSTLTNQ